MDDTPTNGASGRPGGPTAIFLYDGDCGLCDATVQFFLHRTDAASLHFAALQSEFAQRVLRQHGVHLADLNVAYLVIDGRLEVASSAILEALRRVRGPARHLATLRVVPKMLRDRVYAIVARHRRRLVSQAVCRVPSAEERRRFIA